MSQIMNLFLLSYRPNLCAQWHCDKHVVKMILELTQMLYTAHHMTDPEKLEEAPQAYKCAHKNHPMTIWVRTMRANYVFTYKLAWALVKEFRHRYGHDHKCSTHLEWLSRNIPNQIPSNQGMTEVPQCMPDEFKVLGNPLGGYRNYYLGAKRSMAEWKKNRPAPPWWNTTR
jgi:hypothetical protein